MLDKMAGRAIKTHAQAERYVSRALRDIRQIGKLARYHFAEEEVAQIFAAIRGELDAVQDMFKPPAKLVEPEFKFQ